MEKGIYNYFLNEKPTGVIETFNIKILSDGSKMTTSIRDAKPFKTIITVETIDKNDKFKNCKIIYQKDEFQVEADYKFAENSFRVLRKLENKIVQDEPFDLPKDAIFFPLMRCFQGKTISQIAKNQESKAVIVPDIQPTTKFEDLLKPTFDERTAKCIQQKDKRFIYNYLSKHYDDNSEFHLDKNGLLIYYKFIQNEQQIWEISL
jgi:hypothetical protein